jgi:hypothetical protein
VIDSEDEWSSDIVSRVLVLQRERSPRKENEHNRQS